MSTEVMNEKIEEEKKLVYTSEDEEDEDENPLNFDIYDKEEIDSVIQRNSRRDPNNKKRPKTTQKKPKYVQMYQSDYIKERSKQFKDPVFAHLTTYVFVKIEDLEETKKQLVEATKEICGTILLGKEGINLFVSGIKEDVEKFEKYLLADDRFKSCYFKK